jgi:ElaA protein
MHRPLELQAPRWRACPFAELSTVELHGIYMARQQVFVVEQRCAFLDVDGGDPLSWHLVAWPEGLHAPGLPLAYARIFGPGVVGSDASIGRVLTTAPGRGLGLGRELVWRALSHCSRTHPGANVRIAAQSHLEAFYAGFGFVSCSERYLEDGIEHVDMVLRGSA